MLAATRAVSDANSFFRHIWCKWVFEFYVACVGCITISADVAKLNDMSDLMIKTLSQFPLESRLTVIYHQPSRYQISQASILVRSVTT